MPPKLQIQLIQDGEITETWTYIPELRGWKDELGNHILNTDTILQEDVNYAIRHALSIIHGTHPPT